MRNHRTTTWVLRAASVALVAFGLPAATAVAANAASLPCTTRTTSTPFTPWGDSNAYFTVSGGTFESGLSGWTTTSGAGVVAGNEPWKAVAGSATSSLRLPATASAKTPTMCVASAENSLRFFYRSPGVSGSALHVSIYVTSGVNVATNDYEIGGSQAGWAVSPRIMLPDIRDASGQQYVSITFTSRSTAATWQVDDVEIDPWRTL